jgi:hypothetical protein
MFNLYIARAFAPFHHSTHQPSRSLTLPIDFNAPGHGGKKKVQANVVQISSATMGELSKYFN